MRLISQSVQKQLDRFRISNLGHTFMERNFQKCSLAIDMKSDLFTICEGLCAKSFHAECVGVIESAVCTFSSNIIWICDPCMAAFCRFRENYSTVETTSTDLPKAIVDDVNQLKNTVAEIVQTLSQLVNIPDPIAPHNRSTPTSSPKTFDGINEIISSTKQNPENVQLPTETDESLDENVFSLYLTNIDKRATENDISLMVARQLDVPLAECLEVVKLVPKWRNSNTLDFVSFKIVLDRQLKSTAMTASTWPKGVKYREFVNRFNGIWQPT